MVHLEKVAVTFFDGLFAVALYGIAKIKEDSEPGGGDSMPGVAEFLSGAG